jgi:hypothetical protein
MYVYTRITGLLSYVMGHVITQVVGRPRRARFVSRSSHLGFMVDKMVLEQVYS